MKLTRSILPCLSLALLAQACLTSEEPFYQQDEIKFDNHLIGIYQPDNEQTKCSIETDPNHTDGYLVTLASDVKPCFMRFSGVLFQVGTNRFFDLLPMLDSCDHVAGSTPGPIEIMQGITLQALHLVLRIDATTSGLRYGAIDGRGLRAAAKQFPDYFQAKGEHLPRMLPDVKKQREFLLRFGGDTNMFKLVEMKRLTQ